MPNCIKHNLTRVAKTYFYVVVFAVLLVSLLPWWPFYQWLIIPKYVLLFGPRWWLLLLSLFIFVFFPYLSKTKKLLLPLIFIGVFNYLDFQLPSFTHYFHANNESKNTVKIIQANIGGGASINEIKQLVSKENPDILLLQEARKVNFPKWLSPEYRTSCKGGLCIASKLYFEETGKLNRHLIGGWGNFAMLYNIKTAQGDFSLANIHFETPRAAIMGFIHGSWDQQSANKIDDDRQFEALLIHIWQQSQKISIIAGDFNMLEDENIYQKYFSSMNNALGVGSVGLNYTKKTSWHGVRIDHLLYSDSFVLKQTKVIDAIAGDHQPVVTILAFNNRN